VRAPGRPIRRTWRLHSAKAAISIDPKHNRPRVSVFSMSFEMTLFRAVVATGKRVTKYASTGNYYQRFHGRFHVTFYVAKLTNQYSD